MAWYGETKVYFDGSHYIAIPHTERPTKRRPKPIEETITIQEDKDLTDDVKSLNSFEIEEENLGEEVIEKTQNEPKKPKKERKLTKKELFNELYAKYIDSPKKKRQKLIVKDMLQYFDTVEHCENFVQIQMERKQRNLICRRARMIRKANLVNFNYFCTFTYDDKLHTEESFKKKLQGCFKMMCHRKGWKYMGVWERAPETKRLHFHGLFLIPENSMPGELFEHSDYSFSSHRRTTTLLC